MVFGFIFIRLPACYLYFSVVINIKFNALNKTRRGLILTQKERFAILKFELGICERVRKRSPLARHNSCEQRDLNLLKHWVSDLFYFSFKYFWRKCPVLFCLAVGNLLNSI